MNLHKDKNLFQKMLQSTSDLLGLPLSLIEKDYWCIFRTILHHYSAPKYTSDSAAKCTTLV